jgi:hypothetical protein
VGLWLKTDINTSIMSEPTEVTIEKYLSGVAKIIRETEEELDKDGSRFNVFYILNLETSEVRLHSAFIAELLDPGGTHSFKAEFLKLFIKDLKEQNFGNHKSLTSFDISSCRVEVEKWIGFTSDDRTSGGRIDIVISDNYKNRIIIENKITAGDQPKQLLRYHNFDPNSLLLYLTLGGDEPNNDSTGGTLMVNKDFFLISYEEFILQWLMKCHTIASGKPKVKETISQYMNIIKDYTSQSPIHIMKEKITKLIASDKDFYNSVEDIYAAYQALNQSINNKFWERLKGKITLEEKLMDLSDNIDLHYSINEDSDGFFFGFYLRKKNMEQVDCSLPEYQHLVIALKGIRSVDYSNYNYICWIFPESMPRRIDQLNKEEIFNLQENAKMESLTDQIVDEFYQVKKEVIERIENIKIN